MDKANETDGKMHINNNNNSLWWFIKKLEEKCLSKKKNILFEYPLWIECIAYFSN